MRLPSRRRAGRHALAAQFQLVIRTHPVTKRKTIYVNEVFTTRIEGCLCCGVQRCCNFAQHVQEPEFQCRFRWQPHSIASWDNRSVQHQAAHIDFIIRTLIRLPPSGRSLFTVPSRRQPVVKLTVTEKSDCAQSGAVVPDRIAAAAVRLHQARVKRRPIAPLSCEWSDLSGAALWRNPGCDGVAQWDTDGWFR